MTVFPASEVWVNTMEDQAAPRPSVKVFKTVRRRFQTLGSSAGANQVDEKGHTDATPVSGTARADDGPEKLQIGQALSRKLPPSVPETSANKTEEAGPRFGQYSEQKREERAHTFQGMHAPAPASHSQQPTHSLAMTLPSEGVHLFSQDLRQWPQPGPFVGALFQEERPILAGQQQWNLEQTGSPQGPGGLGQTESWGWRDRPHCEPITQEQAKWAQEPPPPQVWQPQSELPDSKTFAEPQHPTSFPPQIWQPQQGQYHPPGSEQEFKPALGRGEISGGALLSRQNGGVTSQGWTDDERREMQDLLGCMLPSADDAALMRKVSQLRDALDEESRLKALACHDAESLRLRVYDLEARNAALDTQLHALMTSAGDVSGEAALAAAHEVWQRAFESARAANQSEVKLTEARLAEGLEAERGERERLIMEAAQSRLLYRAKGRQFRTVREELAASERRGEELERGTLALRNEVEGWQRRVEALEVELRRCEKEVGDSREEVADARAAAAAAEERWRGEEARRKESELEAECLEERIEQLESHDTGALLRRYDQQLQQARAGFHTKRTQMQQTIRDLQTNLAEARKEAAEGRLRVLEESGVNGGSSKGTGENKLCVAELKEVKADDKESAGPGGMPPESASQDAEREAAEAKGRARELERRLEALQTETAELRERLDEAEKAELRRGGFVEEAGRLRERCAALERERSAYSHQVERLEEERTAHSHQVERLGHQVWMLRGQLGAVESKAEEGKKCAERENAEHRENAGESEAGQGTEGRKSGEGVESGRVQVLPGVTERLGWEPPESAVEPGQAENRGISQQDWKEETTPPGQPVELDDAPFRTGGNLRLGEKGRGAWFGEPESERSSERSMLLAAAQEEIEKLQEVNGRLMEALRTAQRDQGQRARTGIDLRSDSRTNADKGPAAKPPTDDHTNTTTKPFAKTSLHEQLVAAKADARKAWAEIAAGRQRLAQLEEKLLAGRSLLARQEDLFRDLRAEVAEGKSCLATQGEAFRELREELSAAREELDVSRRLLRKTAPGVGGEEKESWGAGGIRERGEAGSEAEKGIFGGQVLGGDAEAGDRGERSPNGGETEEGPGATFFQRAERAHVDGKDDVRNGRGDVSMEKVPARALLKKGQGALLEGLAEETEGKPAEMTRPKGEAKRDAQFEGEAAAGGMTSFSAIGKADEHSDWDAIERESELLLRGIEQAYGQGDESGNASNDESVNGLSDVGVNGHREENFHWVGEESTGGPWGGVNGLQVGSVNGGSLVSVAESTKSVQGHVGATSAPRRHTTPVQQFEVGESRAVGKEQGIPWGSIEAAEETISGSSVKLTQCAGEQEARRFEEIPSGDENSAQVRSVGRPDGERLSGETVCAGERSVAQRAVGRVSKERLSAGFRPGIMNGVERDGSGLLPAVQIMEWDGERNRGGAGTDAERTRGGAGTDAERNRGGAGIDAERNRGGAGADAATIAGAPPTKAGDPVMPRFGRPSVRSNLSWK